MEVREARINQIKNISLIYIYTTDSILNNDSNKYIGAKVVYDGNKTINIDYKDKHFSTFIKRIIERYQKEKNQRRIVLLGDLTKKLMETLSFDVVEKEANSTSKQIPLFKVENRNLLKYKSALKEIVTLVMTRNLKYDNIKVKDIIGYNNHYQVTYQVGNIEKTFPLILYNDEDTLYFEINRIDRLNTDIHGKIELKGQKLEVTYDDGEYSAEIIYDSESCVTSKSMMKDLIPLHYEETDDVITEEEIKNIKSCLSLFGDQVPSNILKVGENSYLLSQINSEEKDDDILYNVVSYLLTIDEPLILTKTVVDGFIKYKGEVKSILGKTSQEIILKKIKVEGKDTLIEEIRTTTDNTETFEYNVLDEDEKYTIAEKTLDGIKALVKSKRSNSNICLKEE
jgi:hypothetical protein